MSVRYPAVLNRSAFSGRVMMTNDLWSLVIVNKPRAMRSYNEELFATRLKTVSGLTINYPDVLDDTVKGFKTFQPGIITDRSSALTLTFAASDDYQLESVFLDIMAKTYGRGTNVGLHKRYLMGDAVLYHFDTNYKPKVKYTLESFILTGLTGVNQSDFSSDSRDLIKEFSITMSVEHVTPYYNLSGTPFDAMDPINFQTLMNDASSLFGSTGAVTDTISNLF